MQVILTKEIRSIAYWKKKVEKSSNTTHYDMSGENENK